MEPSKKRQKKITDFGRNFGFAAVGAPSSEVGSGSVPAVFSSVGVVASVVAGSASLVPSLVSSSGLLSGVPSSLSSGASSGLSVGVASGSVAVPVAAGAGFVGRPKNVGGASKLEWFNVLATHPELEGARRNLFGKIQGTTTDEIGCITVNGFKEETRPTLDKSFVNDFKRVCPDGPARFSPYHIAMLKEKVLVPNYDPPPYPLEHRIVKQKRSKHAAEGNEKSATWVASHLCHHKQCINATEHLCWEPSWFNRLRDNCPGGEVCIHRPRACLKAHRENAEVIDWTLLCEAAAGDPEKNS